MYILALLLLVCGVLDSHFLRIRRYHRDESPLRDLLFVPFSSSSAIGYISVIGSGCYGRNAEDRCLLVSKCTAALGLLDDRTPPTRVSSCSDTRFSRVIRTSRFCSGLPPPTRRSNMFRSDLTRLRMYRRLLSVTRGVYAPRPLVIHRPVDYTDRRVSTECPRNPSAYVVVARPAVSPIPGKPFDPCRPKVGTTRAREGDSSRNVVFMLLD